MENIKLAHKDSKGNADPKKILNLEIEHARRVMLLDEKQNRSTYVVATDGWTWNGKDFIKVK